MKFIISESGNASVFVKGKPYSLTPETINYDKLILALRANDEEAFYSNLVNDQTLGEYCAGLMSFSSGFASWDGIPIPDIFSDRILQLVEEGYEFEPMLNFVRNLCENPSDQSIVELIDFLRNRNLPLTKDGCFLGYKRVRDDYKDCWSGTFDNSIGKIVNMPRAEVNDKRQECSSNGLHVGALEYVMNNFKTDEGRVIIVKVNPKDVVSVPTDYSFMKLRCCEYRVMGDYESPLTEALYEDSFFAKKIEESHTMQAFAEPMPEITKTPGWREKLKTRFSSILSILKGK
jgi:hypothetical protein